MIRSKAKILLMLTAALLLSACGEDSEQSAESNAPTPQHQAEQVVEEPAVTGAASGECGKGGTECPAGLECVTFRGGMQSCGPEAVEAVVMIKDGTLGGGCISPNPADPLPGASLASIHVVGNDGEVAGYGRLLWDQPGFEVAAERGTPPDGSGAVEDACANYYNLGCDGQAVFEIVDEDGEVQKLREGQLIVAHLRGQEACGEEVADEIVGAVCNDPAAAASGDLSSCTFKVRMIDAREDTYGPDRVGGTIQYLPKTD